jgi:hypothetical protein
LDSAKGGSGCLMPFLFLLVYVLGSCRTLKNTLLYKKNIMVSIIIIVQLNKEEGKSRQPTKKKREI